MLERHLSRLEGAGLVLVAKVEPEIEYLFRHALVQDAAYDTLLKSDRRLLHRLVADVLEASPEGQRGALAATLAYHYEQAEEWDEARAAYALAEALGHTARAIEIGRQQGASAGELSVLFLRQGRILELTGRHTDAETLYLDMEAFARERGEGQPELDGLVARMTLYSIPTTIYDADKAQALAERGLEMARALGAPAAEASILWNLSLLYYFTGDIEAAVENGKHSVALAREHDLREQLAYSLQDLSRPLLASGKLDETRESLSEAIPLWRELGNLSMLVDSMVTLCAVDIVSGNLADAFEQCEEALAIADHIDSQWGRSYAQSVGGIVELERGNLGLALTWSEQAYQHGVRLDALYLLSLGRSEWAWRLAVIGAMEKASVEMQGVLEFLQNNETPSVFKACCYGAAAHIAIGQGDLDEAERLLELARDHYARDELAAMIQMTQFPRSEAELLVGRGDFKQALDLVVDLLDYLHGIGVYFYTPNLMLTQARALLGLEREDEALTILQEALAEAERQDARLLLWKILRALDDLQPGEGHGETAQAVFDGLLASLADLPDEQAALRDNAEQVRWLG